MAWFWRAGDDGQFTAGGSAPGDDELGGAFASQAAAEGWLTANYPALTDAGVTSVSLYEEDRRVYGPMSLAAE